MGLDVAQISDLAALRPIQTTAVTGALATAGGGADGDDAAPAADAGCVTPTASCAACVAHDGIGSATPTAAGPSYSTPTTYRTTAPLDGAAVGDAAFFTTPTSEDSALRPATVCPPVPRKQLAPALKRKMAPLQQRLFYPVPRDLASVFVPAPPPAAKKTRAHSVESSLPLGT